MQGLPAGWVPWMCYPNNALNGGDDESEYSECVVYYSDQCHVNTRHAPPKTRRKKGARTKKKGKK
jgi:hypothetical protein